MVHLIILIKMTTHHAFVLWDYLLRTVFLRFPTPTLSRKPCSTTFKLKTGGEKKHRSPYN